MPTTRPHSNGSDQSKSPTEAVEAEKIPTTPVSRAAQPPKFDPVLQVTFLLVFWLIFLQKNLSQAAAAMLSQSVKPQIQNPFSMWRAGNPYSALAPFNQVAEDKSTNKGTYN